MGNAASGGRIVVLKDRKPSLNKHVFISYCHKDKVLVNKVYKSLKDNCFEVWFDEDCMGGNLLDGMSKAVEDSWVVLICMSQHYQNSANCRTEAEYTFQQRKEYIILKLQENFSPKGWLGATLGTKMFYDFSKSGEYDKKLKQLILEMKAVRDRVLEKDNQVPIAGTTTENVTTQHVAITQTATTADQAVIATSSTATPTPPTPTTSLASSPMYPAVSTPARGIVQPTGEFRSRILTLAETCKFGSALGNNWESFFLVLGFSLSEVDTEKQNCGNNVQRTVARCLAIWYQDNREKATYQFMIEALIEARDHQYVSVDLAHVEKLFSNT